MRNIKGIVFSGACGGSFASDSSKISLLEMKNRTSCNSVVFVISAIVENSHSDCINFKHDFMPKDEEIIEMINYAQEIGLQTILKTSILCLDGTKQAEIDFENQLDSLGGSWGSWFEHYTDYIMHYAKLAQISHCNMLIVGGELAKSEKLEEYWRRIIERVRSEYNGLLTYNVDSTLLDNVIWWDALDYISSSGYIKIPELKNYLTKVDEITKRYNKPFFFSEMGCKSCTGSSKDPGDWKLQGDVNFNEQKEYFDEFFQTCQENDCVSGLAVWNWWNKLRKEQEMQKDTSYEIYGKPACDTVRNNFVKDNKRLS